MTTAPARTTATGDQPGRVASAADALLHRMMRLPQPRGRYTVERGLRTPTRDGFELVGDHYIPDGPAKPGTVLIRSPYGRGFPHDLLHARVLAAAGHHVLLQSVRGTFGSTDAFQPMAREADDGHDTVAWLREQPWFDGSVATIGASYLGWVQWALLLDPPPELKACVMIVGPHDFGDAVYGTGAFTLKDFLGWSEMIVHQEEPGLVRRIRNTAQAGRRLTPAYAGLPLGAAAEQVLDGRAPWYPEWVAHADLTDPFWAPRNYSAALATVEVPMLIQTGWQDLFLRQSIQQYEALHARGVDVALTVGPWSHVEILGKGTRVVGPEAIEWMDVHLAGGTRTRTEPVRVEVTGGAGWRELPQWPPRTTARSLHLHPGGELRPGEPVDGSRSSFRYDPADPTPTVGGRILSDGAGVQENRALEARPDVLTFTTPPLPSALEVLGEPVVELAIEVDNPHADVFVRLCDVDPKGRSLNFSDAMLRLDPSVPAGELQRLELRLDPCAHRLAAGHRLRLQISGGSHPRFARNIGSGEPPLTGATLRPSVRIVHHTGSRVTIPAG